MTLNDARHLALALPEATEEPHFDLTSFRICAKIFATAPPDGETLRIFIDPAQVEESIATAPDYLETLHWGKKVAGICVLLPVAKPAIVAELLRQAWSRKAPRRLL